jgi:hypothetical protein
MHPLFHKRADASNRAMVGIPFLLVLYFSGPLDWDGGTRDGLHSFYLDCSHPCLMKSNFSATARDMSTRRCDSVIFVGLLRLWGFVESVADCRLLVKCTVPSGVLLVSRQRNADTRQLLARESDGRAGFGVVKV